MRPLLVQYGRTKLRRDCAALDKTGDTLSMAWTNWPMFTVGMVQRGHSDTDIQKILGGNMLRVARAALK